MHGRFKRALFLVALTLCTSVNTACHRTAPHADLKTIYNRSAQHHGPDRNPVIVIPGILGSRLRDSTSGRIVWGAFGGEYANPTQAEDLRLIALPMTADNFYEQADEVIADGALDRIELDVYGLPFQLGAYANILGALGVGGYRDEALTLGGLDYGESHYTCFQFPYDWRRDIAASARSLHQFILQKKAYVEAEHRKLGHAAREVKFDIVAHSMGGLVTRYYLMYGPVDLPADGSLPPVTWFGARYIDKAVLVGTPNAGALDSLVTLLEGLPIPLFPDYPPALLGTLPAVYQLLPRPRHGLVTVQNAGTTETVDLYDPQVWKAFRWGLANPSQDPVLAQLFPEATSREERMSLALEYLRKVLTRTEQLHRALDAPAALPDGVKLYLVLGDAVGTKASFRVEPLTGVYKIDSFAPGDGTVLRSSALLDERLQGTWTPQLVTPIPWTHVTMFFRDHLGLTAEPTFVDNVLYLLLESPLERSQTAYSGG